MPETEEKEEEEKSEDTTVTMEKVNEAIQEALKPIRDMLGGSDNSSNDDKGDNKDATRERASEIRRTRRSLADIERDAEALVQKEVQKIFDAKEHEAEHKRIEKERSKPQHEIQPVKERRLTKLFLGKGYQESHTK